MNPYHGVTEPLIDSVDEAIADLIGAAWDGIQHPKAFLVDIAGPDLANEYLRAVDQFMEWREAEAFLQDDTIPYYQRTFAKYFLHKQRQPAP
jgi:hypothetical protein